jgi:hypothetical protein
MKYLAIRQVESTISVPPMKTNQPLFKIGLFVFLFFPYLCEKGGGHLR